MAYGMPQIPQSAKSERQNGASAMALVLGGNISCKKKRLNGKPSGQRSEQVGYWISPSEWTARGQDFENWPRGDPRARHRRACKI
jgi:hypothetical protein